MLDDKLSNIQQEALKALSAGGLKWRLTGGGALIAAYTHHRQTRDLDLFFARTSLANIPSDVRLLLESAGFEVSAIQSSPAFVRLMAKHAGETVIIDLVADNTPPVDPPRDWDAGGFTIQIDSPHEILVNKLCALLGRAEIRDLIDVEALLKIGGNLDQALADSPAKDAGFSPLTLAWVLRGMPIDVLCRTLGINPKETARIAEFRDKLVDRVVETSAP